MIRQLQMLKKNSNQMNILCYKTNVQNNGPNVVNPCTRRTVMLTQHIGYERTCGFTRSPVCITQSYEIVFKLIIITSTIKTQQLERTVECKLFKGNLTNVVTNVSVRKYQLDKPRQTANHELCKHGFNRAYNICNLYLYRT